MPYPMFPFTPFFGLQSLPPLPLNYPFMYPSSMSDRMTPNADKASDEGYMSPTASETSSCSVDASDLHQTPSAQQSTSPTGFFPFSPAQFFPEKSPSLTGTMLWPLTVVTTPLVSPTSSVGQETSQGSDLLRVSSPVELEPTRPSSASNGAPLLKKEVQDFYNQDSSSSDHTMPYASSEFDPAKLALPQRVRN